MLSLLKELGMPTVFVIGLALSIIAINKILEIKEYRRKTTKDQLDALVGLDLSDNKKEKRFIVEQIFSHKFNKIIPYAAINILIGTANPSTAINHYIKGKYYLNIDDAINGFRFRSKYETGKKRKIWKWTFIVGYFACGLVISLLVALASMHGKGESLKYAIFFAPFIWVFGFFAYACLDAHKSIKAAEQVMEQI
jgi:hypothetical protein